MGRLELVAPTASSPHQVEDLLNIDHVAVPDSWLVTSTERHRSFVGQTRISAHDAYVVNAYPDLAAT
ncbi:hypothetical protein C6I20_15935 [Aeromicrobium sp. A1-2]|nr:hypothetical protein C6I20_15935 [Aeromicrobium sp. A1-2]